MSRVYGLFSEKLTQPAFAASRRRSLDPCSDADFSLESSSAPVWRARSGVRSLPRLEVRRANTALKILR